MDDKKIKRRLEDELWADVSAEVKSGARQAYEGKLLEWGYRYQASRSIKGLMLTGQPDPEIAPLTEPFNGCSDVGHPISMTLIQELVPNVMAAMMGSTPYTETKLVTDKGLEPGGDIDDFLYYALERENVRALRRKTVVSSYKYGEGVEKLIFVPEERTITEKRLLLMTKGKNQKVFFDMEGEVVELFDPEKDLKEVVREMLKGGEDPLREFHRHALRELKLSPDQALEAVGFDVKGEPGEQSIRVAPLEQGEGGNPVADWGNSTTYYPEITEVTETIVVSNWPKFVKVPTKDFLWPSDAKTNDIMDYWCGDRYRVDLEWLEERKKEGKNDPEGFYPEVVDRIVSAHQAMEQNKDETLVDRRPEIYEIYSKFVLNKEEKEKDDYLQEVEVIAWFYSGDKLDSEQNLDGECLGWMVNPAVRYDIHHIKPYFVFQVKPEDEGFHGLCVPESCTGYRNATDWELNERLNRAALYGNPPLIMDEATFAHDQDLTVGLGKRWVVKQGGQLDVLDLEKSEANSFQEEAIMLMSLRLLWGASEQMSGQSTKTGSDTAAEANLIAAKGARMFQDTVESLSSTADKQYAYIRQYYLLNDPTDMKIPIKGTDGAEGQLLEITRKMFEPPMLIKSRRVATEAEREMTIGAIKEAMTYLATTQNPLARSPIFVESITTAYFDALNLESIDIPTKEQLMQEQAQMAALQKQAEEREDLGKHASKIPNKGNRNLIQKFLDNPREASKIGAPAGQTMAPGQVGGIGGPGGA